MDRVPLFISQMNLSRSLHFLLVLTLLCMAGCMPLPRSVKRDANIEYARVDGQSLLLDIYSPKQPRRKLPVLVYIHGGGWETGSKYPCPIGFLATQNVAVVSINYRLSGVAHFPAQLYDCKGAIRWLRANADKYNLDPDHIGLAGVSAGGHLAALEATTAGIADMEGDIGGNLNYSSRVQCVVAFYPPTDLDKLVNKEELRNSSNTLVAKFLGGPLAANMDNAALANPARFASKDSPPFFIMHGEQDSLVPVEQSRLLYEALKKAGADVQLEVVPGGHGIIAPPRVAKEIYEFYQKYLGTSPPPQ
jgi:acetyl esterase/lipase